MSFLKDTNPVRKAIAYIAENNGKAALEILKETLKHEDWSIRSYAAQIIGELGKINPELVVSGEIIETLINTMKNDKDGWVREAAAKAMGKIAAHIVLPTADLKTIIEIFHNILESDDHEGARGTAAQSLGDIGAKNPDLIIYSLPLLARSLKKDESWIVRYYAAYALGTIGAVRPKAVEKYLPILREKAEEDLDSGVRNSIKEALKKISQAYNALE